MRSKPTVIIRRRMTLAACLCCCVCCFCFCSAPALASGGVLFVDDDAPAAGDGQTWDSAYQFLQDALVFASEPANGIAEIRVAQGMYQPDRSEDSPKGTGDREATFQLIDNVALVGGYAGIGADDPDERDVDLYETILSGDLLENDQPGFGNYDENSFNICFSPGLDIGEFLIVDGFLFMGGNATGNRSPFWAGGGLRLDESEFESLLSVANCTFVANQALGGGAVSTNDGKVEFSDCLFADNRSIDDEGGAVRGSDTIVEFRRCVFEDNTSATRGGAVYLFSPNGDTLIFECAFERNISGWNGGGLHLGFGDPAYCAIIHDCLFRHNESVSDEGNLGTGGGLYVDDLPIEIVNTAFIENSATFDGAGAYLGLDGSAQITGCKFVGNLTGPMYGNGGGVYLADGDHLVANSLFAGNGAAQRGGGLLFADTSGGRSVVNCTFVANMAGEEGGGLWMHDSDRVFNSIFWLNSDVLGNGEDSQIFAHESTGVIFYSCIDGWTGALGGQGNHGANPLFVDPDNGDYRLAPGSPCIDAADNTAVPIDIDADLDDNPRFVDDPGTRDTGVGRPPIVDMGAYEFQGVSCPWDLDGDNVVGTNDLILLLGSWGDPYGAADLIELLGNWGPCPK